MKIKVYIKDIPKGPLCMTKKRTCPYYHQKTCRLFFKNLEDGKPFNKVAECLKCEEVF